MSTVLVVGGAGYIGSACTKMLCDRGYAVTVFDNLSHGQRDKVDERAKFFEGDVRSKIDLADVFNTRPFDAVMHFAALKSVEESESKPAEYFENNVGGVINLLSAMAEYHVPQIVFSSTAAVYTPTTHGIYTEESEVGAMNVYGNTKLLAERAIQEFARVGAIKRYALLRYFNVAGDSGLRFREKDAANVFPLLGEALQGRRDFNIFGDDYNTRDGTCTRDYVHLSDLVDAHVRALEHHGSGVWNLGTSKGTTVRELVSAFEDVSGRVIDAQVAPRRAGDPATVLADSTKAQLELNWQPQFGLHEMVKSTLEVYAV
jgi:UDP-glucose 4-epimerase